MSIMNYAGFITLVCLAAGLSLYLSRQCNAGDAMVNIRSKNEVEIAPDKWLPVNEDATTYASDVSGSGGNPHNMSLTEALRSLFSSGRKNAKGDTGSSSLSFKWNDKDVFWRGPEIPVTGRIVVIFRAKLRRHDFARHPRLCPVL